MEHDRDTALETFVARLQAQRFSKSFNPYWDICARYDLPNAPVLRSENLIRALRAAREIGVDSLWIARDLGHRGGRRTGLAMTDELRLKNCAKRYGVPEFKKATAGEPVNERTATVVWDCMDELGVTAFLWNVFPFHPHAENEPFTNRCHTRAEEIASRPFLEWLLDYLKPRSIVAVGNDAAAACQRLDLNAHRVRHPSFGGEKEFRQGMKAHYSRIAAS